ncbi:hypothetical protein EJ03DRAFT_266908 [Teratosphaeria nubilosa]|uniref:Uncharacterized protein n=1 Tax=Teratosphaeria nubilosa TaxID=161662 RepID=A0A6G1LII2_9PEZI|nr:hypothetical protein EJ03DRAFT_266908 [Teratosphaeria nubilosa]
MLLHLVLEVLTLTLLHLTSASISPSPNHPQYHLLPSLRDQAEIQDTWRDERTANIPNLLRKHGVDAWLMSQREYAEDTVFWSLKCSSQFSARRRTIHLFFSSSYQAQGLKTAYKWIDNTDAVFADLAAVLNEHNPNQIVLNTNDTIAFASGLHHGSYTELLSKLPQPITDRFTSNPLIAVEYISTTPASQLTWYKRLQETTWSLIAEAFSTSVITPAQTTTTDVEWWLREKVQALNYSTWFPPAVSIVTAHQPLGPESPGVTCKNGVSTPDIIREGDMLHVDFGVTALGLNTDTQHLAYVLRPGETAHEIPRGLREGLEKANRLQDIVREHMIPNRTGNAILAASLRQMRAEGIEGRIYCHAIGDWGHSAGAVVGMVNLQRGVPVLGDLPVWERGYYSVELFVEHFVPERGETLRFEVEEDVVWGGEGVGWEWVFGRQEEFWVVGGPEGLVVQGV